MSISWYAQDDYHRCSHQRCSVKMLSEKFHKFHRKTHVFQSLFDKVAGLKVSTPVADLNTCVEASAWNFISKETPAHVFSREFCENITTAFLQKIPGDCHYYWYFDIYTLVLFIVTQFQPMFYCHTPENIKKPEVSVWCFQSK